MPNNVIFNEGYALSQASYGNFVKVDPTYVESLGYPTSGHGKYALLTYPVFSGTVSISAGDISIGAVEIKDSDSETRVNVISSETGFDGLAVSIVGDDTVVSVVSSETGFDGLAVAIVDGVGVPVTAFGGGEGEAIPGALSAIKVVQAGAIAETTVPDAVGDGHAVAAWYDEFGRQIIAGYNPTLGALNTNQINEAMLNRIGPITNLDGVALTGAGDSINVNGFHNATVHIIASDSVVNAIVTVETSFDDGDANWAVVGTKTVDLSGVNEIAISQQCMMYIRTNIAEYTDGTFTTKLIAGN